MQGALILGEQTFIFTGESVQTKKPELAYIHEGVKITSFNTCKSLESINVFPQRPK